MRGSDDGAGMEAGLAGLSLHSVCREMLRTLTPGGASFLLPRRHPVLPDLVSIREFKGLLPL